MAKRLASTPGAQIFLLPGEKLHAINRGDPAWEWEYWENGYHQDLGDVKIDLPAPDQPYRHQHFDVLARCGECSMERR